ncbi:hypothetical protein CRG98_017821 [Punica granatum]|uniref:Retrotransposon gag domain-containing protein n=1 Tax=Punica granatum TaxID=22663 RepID=A0A2I0JZN0_PUNGR|nr:hypothetical protein CRG98_017821 [Punica granatum]
MTYMPAVSPVSDPMPPPPAPTSVPLPPTAFLSTDSTILTLPPLTIPTQPSIYTVPPPTVPTVAITQVPALTADHFSFQAPQPQMSFPYQAPPPLNIPPTEPGTPTQAAPPALPTNIPPKNEQERRVKRMEETIRALQTGAFYLDHDFKRYDGTKDPRHHLRHYQGKMLQYWDYEEFIIQTFQDSLMGPALDWFMTLKADDIPTWANLSQKFLDQYRFCAETPPTLLELSTMEMKENQAFEAYATEWRGKAAKHVLPIIRTTSFECAINLDPSFFPVSPLRSWDPRAAQDESPFALEASSSSSKQEANLPSLSQNILERSFSAFRVKNRHSRVNSASRVPIARPVRLPRARVPPVHSSRTPHAPSSPNVHALAPEHSSKRSTESPDSRTLPRLFPRIPRLACRKMVWIVVRKTIPSRKWQASSWTSL